MLKDVSQQKLVLETAQELKGMIKMPEWAMFVKTGSHRETMPKNADWWYIRAASILRLANKIGPIGVNKLRTKYGGRKNRGMKPDAFQEASGKVIRVILQQLQAAELIKEHTIGTRKGRITTPKGNSLLIKVAKKLLSEKPKTEKAELKEQPVPKKKETKEEQPAEVKAEVEVPEAE
ncbi:MAG: 30S ribosomal protein S19e [Candidatus Woesearchaeota archaeon]